MKRRTTEAAICLLLAVTVAFVYARVTQYSFINFDDLSYVYGNPHVTSGLTWSGIKWAFLTTDYIYWQPLTWLSHMLDVQFYGLNAGGHHATNVGLHVLNTILLYCVLRAFKLTMWPGALGAAVFALHPLRVESVAWVAERKDVLSASFCLLTMLAYIRYAKMPSRSRYFVVCGLMLLGLMCKPSLVVLPLMLLLLDFWPLGRSLGLGLLKEKVPLFAMASLSSAVTFWGQSKAGSIAQVAILLRIENAFTAYSMYLRKTIWPDRLAIFYPYRTDIAGWRVLGALIVLSGITWLVFGQRKERRYLAFGWLWFLIVPLPMMGFVQSGQQAFADRFTHLAAIGGAVIVACGFAELSSRIHPTALAAAALLIVSTLAWSSRAQVQFWRNSFTLYEHALAVTNDNYLAHYNLAQALEESGKSDDAIKHYAESVRINPNLAEGYYNLGKAQFARGDVSGSEVLFAQAIDRRPGFADAHYALALVQLRENKPAEASAHLSEALRLNIEPQYAAECRRILREPQTVAAKGTK